VAVAKGHPGNPMDWDDMARKFQGLATPALGDRTGPVLALLRRFGDPGTLGDLRGVLHTLPAA
jgi:2-methylcitrate dehydratase PrpD